MSKAKTKNIPLGGRGDGWLIPPSAASGYRSYCACYKLNGKIYKHVTGETNLAKAKEAGLAFTNHARLIREGKYAEAKTEIAKQAEGAVNSLRDGETALTISGTFAAICEIVGAETETSKRGRVRVVKVNAGTISPATLRSYSTILRSFAKWMERRHRAEGGAETELRHIGASLIEEYLKVKKAEGATPQTRQNISLSFRGIFRRIANDELHRLNDPNDAAHHPSFAWPCMNDIRDGARWWENRDSVNINMTEDELAAHRTVDHQGLTREDIHRLIDTAEGELKVLFRIGAQSGMRLGDCATMRWAKDKSDGVSVAVLDQGDTGRVYCIPIKTGMKSLAAVDMAMGEELHDILAKLPNAGKVGAYVMPTLAAVYLNEPSNLTSRTQAVFRKAGFDTKQSVKGCRRNRTKFGFHSLRSTRAASMSSADVEAAAHVLAHSRAGSTTRGYLAAGRTDEKREAEAKAWELWYHGKTAENAPKTPVGAFAVRAGELGRGDVADAQKPVFDAVCAMLNGLAPATLRAVASEALKLAMGNAITKVAVAS